MSAMLRRTWVGMCFLLTTAGTSGLSQERPRPLINTPTETLPIDVTRFRERIENRLDAVRREYLEVAETAYEGFNAFHGRGAAVDELKRKVQDAELAHENAKLTREVSEIALKEYDEGILLQDRATAAGAVALATSDVERVRDSIADYRSYLEGARKQSTHTLTEDLIIQKAEARLREQERRKPEAEAELSREAAKLDHLEKVEAPRRRAELQAKREDALGIELQAQSDLVAAKSALEGQIEEARKLATEEDWDTTIANLDAAAVQMAHIQTKLRTLDSDKRPSPDLNVREIDAQVETAAGRVRKARRSIQVIRLREIAAKLSRFQSLPLATPSATSPPSPIVGLVGDETIESRLDGARRLVIRAHAPLMDRLLLIRGPENHLPSREMAVRAAETRYKAASQGLATARGALKEYVESTSIRERAAATSAVALAESSLKNSQEDVVRASASLDRVRRTATRSLMDADALRQFDIELEIARLQVRKSEAQLEQAKNNLEVLTQYAIQKRLKELGADVELALSEEIGRRQTLTIERDKLTIIERVQTSAGIPAIENAALKGLLEAIRDEAEIRGRIATAQANEKPLDAKTSQEIDSAISALERKIRVAERGFIEQRFVEMARDLARVAKPARPGAARRGVAGAEPSLFEKFKTISPGDRAILKSATEDQKREILKKAGFTDDELKMIKKGPEQTKP